MHKLALSCLSQSELPTKTFAPAEWGHDFRPDYRGLGVLRDGMAECVKMGLPRVPIMALTATATQRVRDEIMGALKLKQDSTKVGDPTFLLSCDLNPLPSQMYFCDDSAGKLSQLTCKLYT